MKTNRYLFVGLAFAVGATAACMDPPVIDYTERPTPPQMEELDDADYQVVVDVDGLAKLSGEVKEWMAYVGVNGASIETVGLAAPVTGTSETYNNVTGYYSLDVDVAGVFWAKVGGADNEYTYNYVRMGQGDYPDKTLYVLSTASLNAMATVYGKTVNPSCATVIADMKTPANQGAYGVQYPTLQGVDYEGPYFLNDLGQPEAGRDSSSNSGKIVFFNVCDTGAATLSPDKVASFGVTDENWVTQEPMYINLYAGGVSYGKIVVEENGAPPPPPDPVVIDFPTEIMPIFQQENCAACHAQGGAAAGTGLYFDGPPENVYAALLADAQVVNIQDPGASYLLTKPLYEDPPNHPNASFPSPEHPGYVALYNWINQGAAYGANPPPDPVVNVDFANDVYPIFQNSADYPTGRNCTGCHNATDLDGGLDLSGGAGVVYQRLADYGLYNVNYPVRSYILTNPYCGPTKCAADAERANETHPTEVFATEDDPGYQLIYQWVSYGAVYEGEPPPPEPPPLQTNVDFFENVMSRFARRGCIGCHDAQDPDGGLQLEGTPQQVYDSIIANGAVDTADYRNSTLYTKSNAYFADVNHGGGKQIPNEEDNYALYIGGWIYEGANYVDPGAMSLQANLYPLFSNNSLGCQGCHGNDGGLTLYGDAAGLYTELVTDGRVVANQPYNSSLVQKAFDSFPDVNHAGGKKAIYDYYKEYNIISTWIFEGAQDN
jgi:hypothetical protein